MRVLYLRRQNVGGITTLTDSLVAPLSRLGVYVTVEDATPWMPKETDLASSRGVTKRLKNLGQDFDLVHAFGYRPAWACSDAFGTKEAWLYTAYDLPKTTHRLLIEKLNEAQAGFCSSHAVRNALTDAGAMDLVVRYPGVSARLQSDLDVASARELLQLPSGRKVVGALGRLVPEHSFDSVFHAMEEVWQYVDAHLVLAGDGPEYDSLEKLRIASSRPDSITLKRRFRNPGDIYRACDLFVSPFKRAGFSLAVAEAMTLGVPPLVRARGGLEEMVITNQSGFTFETDEEFGLRISEALQMTLTLEAIANAAKIHAEALFGIEVLAESLSHTYERILN